MLGYIAAFCVGLILGLLGGGGSILAIPVLIYLFSVDPVQATAYALFMVGTTSMIGAPGIARTLFAAAFAQMLVPVIALLIWPPPTTSWSPGIFGVFLLTAFFAALFLVSGLLFQRAGIG